MKMKDITMNFGVTINTGGHEFTRLEIGCTVQVDEAGADAAYDEARDWCYERLGREVKLVRRGFRKGDE